MLIFGETERLILRQMSLDDFDEVAQIMRGSQVQKVWEYYFEDEDIKDWICKNLNLYEKYNLGYFLAETKDTSQVTGQIALMPDTIDGKKYHEIGYILKESFINNGYALEGAKYMASYAFENLNLNEVIFEIRPENLRSINIAKKLGAKPTGTFTKQCRGKDMEHLIFTLNA